MEGLIANPIFVRAAPIVLLTLSNLFMTFAWYGHLRFRGASLLLVILASWLIALPEYMLAVPANRIGSYGYSGPELKVIQEIISLSIFAVFSVYYLHQPFTLNHGLGFLLIAAGAIVVFRGPF